VIELEAQIEHRRQDRIALQASIGFWRSVLDLASELDHRPRSWA